MPAYRNKTLYNAFTTFTKTPHPHRLPHDDYNDDPLKSTFKSNLELDLSLDTFDNMERQELFSELRSTFSNMGDESSSALILIVDETMASKGPEMNTLILIRHPDGADYGLINILKGNDESYLLEILIDVTGGKHQEKIYKIYDLV